MCVWTRERKKNLLHFILILSVIIIVTIIIIIILSLSISLSLSVISPRPFKHMQSGASCAGRSTTRCLADNFPPSNRKHFS